MAQERDTVALDRSLNDGSGMRASRALQVFELEDRRALAFRQLQHGCVFEHVALSTGSALGVGGSGKREKEGSGEGGEGDGLNQAHRFLSLF